ncbi:MAG: hypothetical protein AAF570_10810 [Bacteroidota bacterium]
MPPPSDKLFQLIHAMTRGEKRAFGLYMSRYEKTEKSACKHLFDIVAGQESYDEAALQAAFATHTELSQLPVIRHQLTRLILESLAAQARRSDLDFQLSEGLEHCALLHRRGMSNVAERRLVRLIRKGEKYEKYDLVHRMLRFEKAIKRRTLSLKAFEAYRRENGEARRKVLARMQNQLEMQDLVDDIFALYRRDGGRWSEENAAQYAALMADPLLQDVETALSLRARWNFYLAWSVYHFVQGDFAVARRFTELQLAAFEARPEMVEDNLTEYLSVQNNYMTMLLELDDDARFLVEIEKVRSIPTTYRKVNKFNRRRIFEVTTALRLEFVLKRGQYEEGKKWVQEAEAGCKKYGDGDGTVDFPSTRLARPAYFHSVTGPS